MIRFRHCEDTVYIPKTAPPPCCELCYGPGARWVDDGAAYYCEECAKEQS